MTLSHPRPRRAALLVLLAACLGASSPAAASPEGQEARPAPSEIGAWVAGAPFATALFGGLKDDETRGRASLMLAVRYARTEWSSEGWAFRYVFDLIPAEMAFGTVAVPGLLPGDPRSRKDVYGFGINPFGLDLTARRGHFRPYGTVSGGVVEFQQPVPLPQETRFVFSGDVDAGVQVVGASGRALVLGIRFHHISNAGQADTNRGLNLLLLHVGVSLLR